MTVLFGVREQHLLLSLAEHFHNQTLQSRTCYYMINMSATYKLKKVLKSGFVQLLLSYLSSNRCMLAWCHQKYYLIFFKMIPYLLQLFLIWKCSTLNCGIRSKLKSCKMKFGMRSKSKSFKMTQVLPDQLRTNDTTPYK